MDGKPVVLVAAHQPVLRRLVAAALKPARFTIVQSDDDESTLDRVSDLHPDVLLLESTDPPSGTFDTIKRVRGVATTPIVVMAPRATPAQMARTLDAGADDCIARPFDPTELAARIRSLVRRRGGRFRSGRRRVGRCIVDLGARRVLRDGHSIALSRPEWTLLDVLLAHEGRVVFHDELEIAAFGPDHVGDVTQLRTWIGRLRRKLGLGAWEEGPIRTVRGLGYAFDPGEAIPRFRSRPCRSARSRESTADERGRLPR